MINKANRGALRSVVTLSILMVVLSVSARAQIIVKRGHGIVLPTSGNNITLPNSTGCFSTPSGAATHETCTTGFSPSNGRSLGVFVWVDPQTGTVSDVTCTDGEAPPNTYTQDQNGNTTNTFLGAFFRATNISGSGTYTIDCTITGGGTGFIGIIPIEFTNFAASPLDAHAGTQATSTNPNPGNITTANANDIVLSCFGSKSNSNSTLTQPSGYTVIQSTGNGVANFVGGCAYQLLTGTATQVGGWTYSPSFAWSATHVSYKSN